MPRPSTLRCASSLSVLPLGLQGRLHCLGALLVQLKVGLHAAALQMQVRSSGEGRGWGRGASAYIDWDDCMPHPQAGTEGYCLLSMLSIQLLTAFLKATNRRSSRLSSLKRRVKDL